MRYLRSIKENNNLQDNIDLISDIEDIFIFLDDDWGLDVKCSFVKIEDNLTLGNRNLRKYNKNGNIYREKNSDISKFGSGVLNELVWTLESRGRVNIDNSILDLYKSIDTSIERCCKTFGFDELATRGNIEFGFGKTVVRFETFFFVDTINTGESEISRLEKYIEDIIYHEKRRWGGSNLDLRFGVTINLQFRK